MMSYSSALCMAVTRDTWLESEAEREPYERALAALDGVVRAEEESSAWLNRASLLLEDPLSGNHSGDQRPHLRLVADRTGK